MFLQPQHFQQQDRYAARQLDVRMGSTFGWPWGLFGLQIDESALLLGRVVLRSARGVLPDGTAFAIPDDDAAPPSFEVPSGTRDELIVLAAAMARPGVPESDVEEASVSMPPRYLATDVDVADVHAANLRAAPLMIGRLNLRLMLASDANEGYTTLGIARVVERRADGRLLLDTNYVPPMLHAMAQPVLQGYVREVHGMLHQRGEALAGRLAQPGRAGIGEITDFLLLQTVNRIEPLIDHLQKLPVLHPERLYALYVGLAGELATFRGSRRPVEFPPYGHDQLATCFRAVMVDLRQSLSMVLEQTAVPIELQERKHGVRVAIISDIEMQRKASFVLAVNAQMPSDTLRARFPAQVKIGPAERLRDLVSLQLPGVGLRTMPVAPRQIPYHAGFTYFELETRGNDLWKQLETSGGLAIHVAGDFPGLELSFWAIRS